MALLQILEYPDPVCERSPRRSPPSRRRSSSWSATWPRPCTRRPGVGLAATQVDVHKRVIVIDISEARDDLRVFINPEIVAADGEAECEEGCLSVPGYYDKVTRAARVRVRALGRARRAVRARRRGHARRVHAARDGPPRRQGLRRPPLAAEARAARGQAAQEAAARGLMNAPTLTAFAAPARGAQRPSAAGRALTSAMRVGFAGTPAFAAAALARSRRGLRGPAGPDAARPAARARAHARSLAGQAAGAGRGHSGPRARDAQDRRGARADLRRSRSTCWSSPLTD